MSKSAISYRTFGPMPKTDCSEIMKALADQSRVRIVKALLDQSHNVNDLAETLAISQYNISKHLRILRKAGIVEAEPNGTRREYHIAPAVREQTSREEHTLNFGCCSFRFDELTG